MTAVRLRILVRGAVQGVGFRPYVYRLAAELQLPGWVNNSSQGVSIEVEGPRDIVEQFLVRLPAGIPPRSFIQSLEPLWMAPAGFATFEIRPSDPGGDKLALVMPDIATCPDCLADVRDPAGRRYRYPFTNCTHCGPRFSIIQDLPYDRANTTMRRFVMCADCQTEYDNPLDRRFHAQPNACPRCGPRLQLWSPAGLVLSTGHDALCQAAQALGQGLILAVKGLGGFHLMTDARSDEALARLRSLKRREEKPFAVLAPSLQEARRLCALDPLEERLLLSPESPIVLLRRRGAAGLSPLVAPGNPNLGVMLPSNPIHHLLAAELGFTVVATSGNLSDEPICTSEDEALSRLAGIASLFLVHDRPIARPVDDSVVRSLLGREQVLRRARGYAPLPVASAPPDQPPAIAVGGHLKNTVALAAGGRVILSQHIGDLETPESFEAFRTVIADLQRLYGVQAAALAADEHPGYRSSQFARQSGLPVQRVQHHLAHVLACMAENDIPPPVLGVCFDGAGHGLDGAVWGGEFLRVENGAFERAGRLRPFRLPGGESAAREPRRAALGVLYEIYGDALFDWQDRAPVAAFTRQELALLRTALARGLNCPATTSAGRLFDAVASLTGLRQRLRFEGQAAMELEFALDAAAGDQAYDFPVSGAPFEVDWRPAILQILADTAQHQPVGLVSARFHNGLARAIVEAARLAGLSKVALTGGCFQNKVLTERAAGRLAAAGFDALWHQRVPPNDGGIALGQAAALAFLRDSILKSCV